MILEIKLKYYNSTLQVGFNDWKKIYDCKQKIWVEAKYHLGRIVYGNNRLPYTKIKKGIDGRDYVVQDYLPF